MRVGLVGCGRAGTALGRALARRRGGIILSGLCSRRKGRTAALSRRLGRGRVFHTPASLAAGSDTILLCVPDDAVEGAARQLASGGALLKGKVVLHLSGLLGMPPLEAARRGGAAVGSLHPLTAFPPASSRVPLAAGIWFAVGGDRRAVAAGRRIASHVEGNTFVIPERSRPAYHLAATIIANHSTALAAVALGILERRAGLKGPGVRRAFASLLRSAADRIEEVGPRRGVTGPAARGDALTLRRHLELLEREEVELGDLYRSLSTMVADLAEERGDLDPREARAVRHLLARSRRRRR
jgi:predicted short-subunit dehydrogenase-like oxidoreductase (DUF2520 family)